MNVKFPMTDDKLQISILYALTSFLTMTVCDINFVNRVASQSCKPAEISGRSLPVRPIRSGRLGLLAANFTCTGILYKATI